MQTTYRSINPCDWNSNPKYDVAKRKQVANGSADDRSEKQLFHISTKGRNQYAHAGTKPKSHSYMTAGKAEIEQAKIQQMPNGGNNHAEKAETNS